MRSAKDMDPRRPWDGRLLARWMVWRRAIASGTTVSRATNQKRAAWKVAFGWPTRTAGRFSSGARRNRLKIFVILRVDTASRWVHWPAEANTNEAPSHIHMSGSGNHLPPIHVRASLSSLRVRSRSPHTQMHTNARTHTHTLTITHSLRLTHTPSRRLRLCALCSVPNTPLQTQPEKHSHKLRTHT